VGEFPYDVNTPEGRAQVRELVAQGRLPRWPLCTEIVAAQLDVPHDHLMHGLLTDDDCTAILDRFGFRATEQQRAFPGAFLVERGVLTAIEGLWLDGDDVDDFLAGALPLFTDEELAEELCCDPSVIWRLRLRPRYPDGLANTLYIAEILGCDYARLVELLHRLPTPEQLYNGATPPNPGQVLRRYRQLQIRDPSTG